LRTQNTQRGFTLLELLVVMTLLSVVMIGLVSALRTMAQTEPKIDQRLERLDEIRIARFFLQQTLARVSSLPLVSADSSGKKPIPFIATPDSLIWVGIMPARPNVGGRYFFHLAIEDTAGPRELVLRFTPWQANAPPIDWGQTEARILVKGITHIEIQAQGSPPDNRGSSLDWPKGWSTGWPITDTLPERIRLRLTDAQGDWPDWTIALLPLPSGDNSFSTVVVGGSVK
jgi:general secretion pathway protein J